MKRSLHHLYSLILGLEKCAYTLGCCGDELFKHGWFSHFLYLILTLVSKKCRLNIHKLWLCLWLHYICRKVNAVGVAFLWLDQAHLRLYRLNLRLPGIRKLRDCLSAQVCVFLSILKQHHDCSLLLSHDSTLKAHTELIL